MIFISRNKKKGYEPLVDEYYVNISYGTILIVNIIFYCINKGYNIL